NKVIEKIVNLPEYHQTSESTSVITENDELFNFFYSEYQTLELNDEQIQIEIENLIREPININDSKVLMNNEQRKRLKDLYNHIQHFNQEFAQNYNTLENNTLDKIAAINLG
ncbi:1618_t:CDS:1, partial [Dentiscutata erythropus]